MNLLNAQGGCYLYSQCFMDVEYYLLEDVLSMLIFKEAMRVAISKEEGPGGKGYTI